jgi:hypothetical protein
MSIGAPNFAKYLREIPRKLAMRAKRSALLRQINLQPVNLGVHAEAQTKHVQKVSPWR